MRVSSPESFVQRIILLNFNIRIKMVYYEWSSRGRRLPKMGNMYWMSCNTLSTLRKTLQCHVRTQLVVLTSLENRYFRVDPAQYPDPNIPPVKISARISVWLVFLPPPPKDFLYMASGITNAVTEPSLQMKKIKSQKRPFFAPLFKIF